MARITSDRCDAMVLVTPTEDLPGSKVHFGIRTNYGHHANSLDEWAKSPAAQKAHFKFVEVHGKRWILIESYLRTNPDGSFAGISEPAPQDKIEQLQKTWTATYIDGD